MDKQTVLFPVLRREHSDPCSLQMVDNADGLLCFIEEFADIIDEFECWDAKSRPVELDRCARRLLAGIKVPVLAVGPESVEEAVWAALCEYCASLQIDFQPRDGETPIVFFQRIGKA